jgi:hypothetical protein
LFVALLIEAGVLASVALLIVTLVGFCVAAGLAWAAIARFRASVDVFARSREEWRRSVLSIKQMLRDGNSSEF